MFLSRSPFADFVLCKPLILMDLAMVLQFFFSLVIGESNILNVTDNKNVWLMIPNDMHRVVEANSVLTITCVYGYADDREMNFKNFSGKWEMPHFLANHLQV